MNQFVCIHGHFYQPPRENPWLEEVELQDSAYPYHDWNERVTAECYARNADARILDVHHRIIDIVNNYSRISFNFGPTLLYWMQHKSPETYRAILEADKQSQKNFSGHGSAMAQVYNHIIMPLANTRDKRTQIIWGLKDFESRFKRKPEGMWLGETAVDLETLDIMAEFGIKFTVLAPHQAKRFKAKTGETAWHVLNEQQIDTHVAYQCSLPSGRSIALFFYNGPIAQGVAFEGLLNNGEYFAERLVSDLDHNADHVQLSHIATDGETYGHHHKFGDMALAYCLHYIQTHHIAELTVYGEFLEKFPPQYEIEIFENSSWSCVHGVERWRSNCGCSTGGGVGWNQQWRGPLRSALDWLRDQMIAAYEEHMREFSSSPWAMRDEYIDLVLDQSQQAQDDFIRKHVSRDLLEAEKIKLLKLLAMQFNAMLMYTSCGWFFNDISGIETIQILNYAARAMQLAKETTGQDLESGFLVLLEKAQSNVPESKDGRQVYVQFVAPMVVDLLRVGAHYAVSSLFQDYPMQAKMYAYTVVRDKYLLKESGRLKLAIGSATVASNFTREKVAIQFAVLHLGDHNFIGGVDYLKADDFLLMQGKVLAAFSQSNIPETIGQINRYFSANNYSLWYLFKQEQQNILNQVLRSTMEDIEGSFRQIYEHHYPLMHIKNDVRLPLPRMLTTVVEFVLQQDLSDVLEAKELDMDRLRSLVDEMKRWSFKRDQTNLSFVASTCMNTLMARLKEHPEDIVLMEKITLSLELLLTLSLELDLWKAQNHFFYLSKSIYPEIVAQSVVDTLAMQWVKTFECLGDMLLVHVNVTNAKVAV